MPRPLEAFASYRTDEIERLQVLNPTQSAEQLAAFVDRQLSLGASPDWQFHGRFDKRHMTEFVTVTMLSHALCEAVINAVLAIGLAHIESADLFPMLERADIKQKWLHGPKVFAPQYRFPVGSALHESLTELSRLRNTLVHHKIELTVEGSTILEGSRFERKGYDEERIWIRRYFSLPYDLAELAAKSIKDVPLMLLFDRRPIETAAAHRTA